MRGFYSRPHILKAAGNRWLRAEIPKIKQEEKATKHLSAAWVS
jgi:hypothetical protein